MVRIVRPCIRDVVQHLLAVQTQALGDGKQPNRTERPLRVDVQALPLTAAHVHGQLAGHRQGVADLRFTSAELAKQLGDGARLDASAEQRVEVLGAGRDVDELGSAGVDFCGTLEPKWNDLVSYQETLV